MKKITALCLCVALLAVAVVGASLAYFTDTKSATNTFTVGNVKIDLIESKYHREGNDNSGDLSIPDPTHKVAADDGMKYVTTGHTMFTDAEIKADAGTYATDYLGVRSGRNEDKLARLGLSVSAAQSVSAPILDASPLSIECRVDSIIPLGSHDMFIADIVAVDAARELLDEKGRLCLDKACLLYTSPSPRD